MRALGSCAAISIVSLWAAVGCGLSGGAATRETRSAIVGGTVDTGDPAVVALIAHAPGQTQGFLCTASVITPTVLLTAAHCVLPDEVGTNAIFEVITDAQVTSSSRRLTVKEVHGDPSFALNSLMSGHDVAVVILDAPTSITPLPLNKVPLPDSLVGASVRIIGYGLDDPLMNTGAGTRRQVTTKLNGIGPGLLLIGDAADKSCRGDSGGPTLAKINGVETIIGTTSYGDVGCQVGGYYTRLDANIGFLQPYLTQACVPDCAGRACGGDGCGGTCGTCTSSTTCTSGQCVSAGGGFGTVHTSTGADAGFSSGGGLGGTGLAGGRAPPPSMRFGGGGCTCVAASPGGASRRALAALAAAVQGLRSLVK